MKSKIFLLVISLSALALARAATPANPYTAVAERNIFGLQPIPVGPPPDTTPAVPPPKITPTGIMSIFGKMQALFRVAGSPKPGQPAKDESYVLGEGERQDDIEVKKIDEPAGTITFDNHGVIQELALTAAANGTAPVSSPAGNVGGFPAFNSASPTALPHPVLGGRFGRGRGVVSSGDATSGAANPPALGGASSGGAGISPNAEAEKLTPEAQVLMIEKNRLDTQDAVNQGFLPPLPPTVITPPDATGAGGSPLISPPELPGGTGK